MCYPASLSDSVLFHVCNWWWTVIYAYSIWLSTFDLLSDQTGHNCGFDLGRLVTALIWILKCCPLYSKFKKGLGGCVISFQKVNSIASCFTFKNVIFNGDSFPLNSSQIGCGLVWQFSLSNGWIPYKLGWGLHHLKRVTCPQESTQQISSFDTWNYEHCLHQVRLLRLVVLGYFLEETF